MNLQIRQCEITDAKAIHDLNLRVMCCSCSVLFYRSII